MKSTFWISGTINRHNRRIWGYEKPFWFEKIEPTRKLLFGMALSNTCIYGFFMFDANIDGEN